MNLASSGLFTASESTQLPGTRFLSREWVKKIGKGVLETGGGGGGAWRHALDVAIPWYQILVSCFDWSNHLMLTDSG